MKSIGTRLGLAALGFIIPAGLALAAPLPFDDDFDSISQTQLNTAPTGWDSIIGSVDSLRNYSTVPCAGGTGGCVDLDGSTYDSGVLLTSSEFQLINGTDYKLSFQLSGNSRSGVLSPTDTVHFGLGDANSFGDTLYSGPDVTVEWDAAFKTFYLLFTATSDQDAYIFFQNVGPYDGDNAGPVLDNVRLAAVPIPAAGWLLISGLVGLVGVARRRQAGGTAATAVPA